MNSAVFMGSRIVGASLAALVIKTIGLEDCFLIDGVSYIAVMGTLLAMRAQDLHGRAGRKTGERGSVREGFLYVEDPRAPPAPRADDDRVHVRVQLVGVAAAARQADIRG